MAFSTDIHHLPDRFPEGLRVFIIDHDTTQLNVIADLCFQCNYEVTTCVAASFAVHLLRETKGSFDVIVIEAQMPDMDSYEFLQRVTQEIKIPIIMMGVDDTTNARMKSIEKGACEYWVKPLNVNHINNMWQHVVTIQDQDQICRILEVKTGLKIMKRNHETATKETNAYVLEKYSDNDHDQPPTKKNRLSWSDPKLKEQFLKVVNQLGIDKATPKHITKLMNVRGLTQSQVASHLQKVRLGLKGKSKKTKLKKELSKSGKHNQYHVPNNESLEVVQSMPMPMPEQNESVEVVQSMPMPEQNESVEVVQSMPAAEQDQNVVPNSANIQCDYNIPAQAQQHENVFDDFDISKLFTNETNMMVDGSSYLYDEAWHSSEYGTFDWC
ncbi:unnamed protein product [Trifolium pratense]|uniref:Uncharacterized protein n=1 Tax=Trifolium pratense TaxID=57577 RepID=A0ACB0J6J1_TRIPR|nr:unnamed protein product [Trifolium pratense]